MIVYDVRTLSKAVGECVRDLQAQGQRLLGGVQAEGILVIFFESEALGIFHQVYLVDPETKEVTDVTGTVVEQAQMATMQ